MFLEVDFGESKLIDQVSLVNDPGERGSDIHLLGMDDDGQWHELSSRSSIAPVPITGNMRKEAVRQLMARGIRYLLVTPAAFGANDFTARPAAWGIRPSGESGGAYLYWLDPDHTVTEPSTPMLAGGGAAVPPGVYDDADPHIQLREPWTHDPQFQEAYRHTLTYSDMLGASASLTFRGRSITFVYTGARNRGIAEVRIDGQLKERLDLYTANTLWQTYRKYEGFDQGDHVIEIRVTGQRNPLAAGCFVDLDALIVE
jgi:hypothetical protein